MAVASAIQPEEPGAFDVQLAEPCPSPALSRKRGRGFSCGDELFDHYRHTLEALGNQKGLLGLIFTKSQMKFQNPAKLRRLIVDLIDNETWVSMSADVKGDAYEGLLEKNAQDTKSGAGQYSARASCFALPLPSMESFTPRPLIQAIVDVMAPKPDVHGCTNAARGRTPGAAGETVSDPACGTGGFLLAAYILS